ncbi:MAG: hypothetical protein HY717_06680 [Planctomycetes bacterium]|nr:hypothetical protein [Planctomycetota bacterium]
MMQHHSNQDSEPFSAPSQASGEPCSQQNGPHQGGRSPEEPASRLPADTRCIFFKDRLHAYIEMEEEASSAKFISNHLEICPACRAEKDRLEKERLDLLEGFLAAQFPQHQLPAHFPRTILEQIHRRQGKKARRNRMLWRRFVLGAAAGLLVGVTLSLLVSNFATGRRFFQPAPLTAVQQEARPKASTPPSPADFSPAGASLPAETAQPAPSIPAVAVLARPPDEPADEKWAWLHPEAPVFQAWENIMDAIPCTQDVNQDGLTDVSDAIHLFNQMLAPAASPADELLLQTLWGPDCQMVCDGVMKG